VAKQLIITEKRAWLGTSPARSRLQRRAGYFESSTWVLTWAVGHLFELLEPEEIDPSTSAGRSPTSRSSPRPSRQAEAGPDRAVRTIKKLLERADVEAVVNACDAGREGELIFREIVEHFGSAKPIRRLWLQSMTEDAIRDGFAHLRPAKSWKISAPRPAPARSPTG